MNKVYSYLINEYLFILPNNKTLYNCDKTVIIYETR
jgi:hypothetical protein